MDASLDNILRRIRQICVDMFAENLVGVYLHGSVAFGCFCWDQSDIDWIVVTEKPPTPEEKENFIRALLALYPACPPKGLEMSLVLAAYCRQFVYPTPFELHFSNAHRQAYLADLRGYCRRMQGTDPDLAAHFTVIRDCGIALYGPPVKELFGPVPGMACLDSIWRDVQNAPDEILQQPVYLLLNLCRVLAYCREGAVLSKREGAQWGLSHLPPQVRPASAGCRQHLCRRPDILRGWAAGASPGVCRLYAGGNPDLSRPGEKIVKLHNFLHVCWIL